MVKTVENYSVLMSVYYKEKPEYLKKSIQSMLDQTVPTNDFVIVCDGPLNEELDEVIEQNKKRYPNLFQIVRLPQNVGIGGAASEGLKYCKNDLVAKMDSDDIARQDRCEKQLAVFDINPELSIIGSQLVEFEDTIENIVGKRIVPCKLDDILHFAKRRMPFNNITVMYRKRSVEMVGGYSSLKRCEDYELYTRMLHKGCKAQNVDDYLCYARTDKDAYSRRGKFNNLYSFIIVRWKIYRMGFSGLTDFLIPCCGQLVLTTSPNFVKRWLYKKWLRG